MDDASAKTSWNDYLLVGLYSLILFGFAGFSGRPLTMHEARLPQTSREMLWHREWLLPSSGGRPWLERPPLPHWIVISTMKVLGHDDQVWVVRLPSTLMGVLTVLVTMSITGKCFGRMAAVITGFVLATTFKFYQYAVLAEDDMYFAALVVIAAWFFTRAEVSTIAQKRVHWFGFFTGRSLSILGFFAVLGLSSLTKGPLLGILILGGAVGVYLLIRTCVERSAQPLLRYVWLWGWLVLLALTFAWPLWAWHHQPDVLANWKYDYVGRLNGHYTSENKPCYYYPPQLMLALLPWTPFCLLGLVVAFMRRGEREYQWMLCWALVPLVLLSIPSGKHDHYMVPFLAPWAMFGSLGLIELSKVLNVGRKSFVTAIIVLLPGFCLGEVFIAPGTDHTVDDTAFLLRCRNEVPADAALFINAKLGPTGNLDFFRTQFYSRPDARLIHNLSFLRDEKITAPVVYVITRQRDENLLAELGSYRRVDQSIKSHDLDTPEGRFTLFCLTFDPHLHRYPLPAKISSLQAMERSPGPWCGPPMP